jgi:hypothetical protein
LGGALAAEMRMDTLASSGRIYVSFIITVLWVDWAR